MAKLDRAIESIIQNAIERGVFENLSGKGKPLDLRENPMVAKEWRTAYAMLEKEGFALPWMEDRKEIEKDLKEAQLNLKRTWNWRQRRQATGDNSPIVEQEWRRATARFSEQVIDLNRRTEAYNAQIPSDIFFRPRIVLEREIEEIKKSV
jgi:DnaJ family protein C protein 28